jgi:peptide deformylase
MKVKIPSKFKFKDTVLHEVAQPFDFTKPEKNLHLAQRMVEFMKKSNGIGLAAPQLGISARVFVMQTDFITGGLPMQCFNPRIVSHSEQLIQIEEGCLSFPGESMNIKRPAQIEVEYHNHKGELIKAILWGIKSICFQHELDHLDGIVMHNRFEEQNEKVSS